MSANDGKDVLRSLVASARAGDEPSDASLRRLDAKMAALIAIPAATAATATATAAASSLGAKVAIGAAVVAAIGGGTYVAIQVTQKPEPVRAPIVARAQPDAAPAPPDAAPPDAAPPSDAAPVTISHGADAPMTPAERLAWEAKILGQAQDLLKRGDAERALTLLRRLERASRRFGAKLIEERERLMIEAELASGHRAAAVRRAKAFESAFPRSVQLPRIKVLLEGAR